MIWFKTKEFSFFDLYCCKSSWSAQMVMFCAIWVTRMITLWFLKTCSEVWQMHGTVCNYTLIYTHLNGIYQGWGVIATMNGIVYQPPWTFRPSCCARRLPIDTCLVSKKFYKSPLTNYVFGVAMGGLLLKLQNFKNVKLIFGHPVCRL